MLSPLIQFDLEQQLPLIGVDEVGRGALAGPVFAGAVHVSNLAKLDQPWLKEVTDSKKIRILRRSQLAGELQNVCIFGVGQASCSEINELGILPATLLAMRRAIDLVLQQSKKSRKSLVLVDGITRIKELEQTQKTIKKGDSKSFHIAAASIIAKTARDEYMLNLGQKHQGYGWERNAGYGTKVHCEAILEKGPTQEHRTKFIRKVLLKRTSELTVL
jgi:ribonuclease HII